MYISEVCVKNSKLTTLTHKSRAWPSVLPKQLTMLAADAKNSKKSSSLLKKGLSMWFL